MLAPARDGWAPAFISGDKIEVANTWKVQESTITYAFNAQAPEYKGLYLLYAYYNGKNGELPLGEFCVIITDD